MTCSARGSTYWAKLCHCSPAIAGLAHPEASESTARMQIGTRISLPDSWGPLCSWAWSPACTGSSTSYSPPMSSAGSSVCSGSAAGVGAATAVVSDACSGASCSTGPPAAAPRGSPKNVR